ncbi:RAD55 family ATPase [Teichococcus vastitatis]|uniref:non-specific serine/threonine protein kinase n=1 Tax=Teichococcus vastitatis TaxID=2307076 RepID=A0ABS9W063_9PROT|nr:ATPase domain-containing protein [Pseudoroseomonas vastitatis]MCI0752688.1 AAA family ATPase [Pseudoroseomonas vastitatis]
MPQTLQRFTSGIEGLDQIMGGGFVADSTYIIHGHPGSGKTILGNQIAFHRASQGDTVLYVTLLAESHERLFAFLSTLNFFDPPRLGQRINYVSAFSIMDNEGLDGVIRLLRREIPRQGATLLVLDGLLNAREKAASAFDMKKFIAELQSNAVFTNCTALLLTSARFEESSPEYTMVDGIIELREEELGVRSIRRLRVRKSRGSSALSGLHQYEIRQAGLVTYPRLESVSGATYPADDPTSERTSSGIAEVDRLLGGGLPSGSTTLLIGPSGVGKTSWGLHYLTPDSPEPALHFGFYESPQRLQLKASALGRDLSGLRAQGSLWIEWRSPVERLVDAVAIDLLAIVEKRGIKRLFLDGLQALENSITTPRRFGAFLSVLFNELRARGVTTLATLEMGDLFDTTPHLSSPDTLSIADNIVLMRLVERDGRIHRVFSVVKVRDSAFDPVLHDFEITDHGIRIYNRLLGRAFTPSFSVPNDDPV